MAGNLRQGDEQTTRNGILALESAFNGVLRSRQDVEAMRNNLGSGYGGGDGRAYGELLVAWEGYADKALRGLQGMIDSLNTTLSAMQKDQGSANESINNAYREAEAVFDKLTGAA